MQKKQLSSLRNLSINPQRQSSPVRRHRRTVSFDPRALRKKNDLEEIPLKLVTDFDQKPKHNREMKKPNFEQLEERITNLENQTVTIKTKIPVGYKLLTFGSLFLTAGVLTYNGYFDYKLFTGVTSLMNYLKPLQHTVSTVEKTATLAQHVLETCSPAKKILIKAGLEIMAKCNCSLPEFFQQFM